MMSSDKSFPLKKLFFFLLLLLFCIGFCSVNLSVDNDLWARLIAGAHTFETLSVLKRDFLSYTPTHIWYDHEWGASVVFYAVLKYFGAEGLVVLKGIFIYLSIIMCFLTVKERKPESTNAYNILFYIFLFFGIYKVSGGIIRCLLFTGLFFAFEIYVLERARNGKNGLLFVIPPLICIWSNIHGGCLSGLFILIVYAFGEFLNKKPFKKYIYVFFASLPLLLINPYGFDYVKFLFFAGTMNRENIYEWVTPFYSGFASKHYVLFYKAFLVMMITSEIFYIIKNKITYKTIDKTKILIFLMFISLSAKAIRYIPFFELTASALFYDEFYFFINSILQYVSGLIPVKDSLKNTFVKTKEISVYFLAFVLSTAFLINPEKLSVTNSYYPYYPVEFVKINDIKGNLLISFDWGSYASYKLYPNNLIYTDGRYEEVYNPELLIDLKNFHTLKNDWDKVLKEYKTDVMIIEKKYPVYKKLLSIDEYKLVFENNLYGVFVPTDNLKDEYLYPAPETEYYDKTLFDTDIDFKK